MLSYSLKIRKETFYIIMLIILFALASTGQIAVVIGMGLLALLFVIINFKYRAGKNVIIPQIAVALLLFQNFAIGIGAHIGGYRGSLISYLTQIPTLFIGISFVFVLFGSRLKKLDVVYLLYVLYCFLFFFKSPGEFSDKVIYFRNFTVFYMAFSIGRYYLCDREKLNLFIRFFLKLAVAAAIFGLIGMVAGTPFFHAIGIEEVYLAKQHTSFKNGLPGNFFTVIFGVWVNRLASFYYEPVNFSYFMTLACLLAFAYRKKALFFLFVFCGILTFGKGGILILGLSAVCYWIQRLFGRYNQKAVRSMIILGAVFSVTALVAIIQLYFTNDFGTYNHFYGMKTGIKAVLDSPWGNGLGSAGNLLKTAQLAKQDISETGLINMAYQIGIVATVTFATLMLAMAKKIFLKYKATKERIFAVFSFIPFVLLLASLFQENTLAPQCMAGYMIILGGLNSEETIGSFARS